MTSLTLSFFFFFFNDTATTEIYTLSLHDALPISASASAQGRALRVGNRLHRFGRHRCVCETDVGSGRLIRLDLWRDLWRRLRRGERLVLAAAVRDVAGDVDRSALADDRHLYLPGILELVFDLPRDLVREEHGRVVVHLAGLHDHPDLASCLQRVDLLDSRLLGRQLFE